MPRSSWCTSGCSSTDTDEKVKVNSSDTTGYLFPKLCAWTNITLTEVEQSVGNWCVRIDGPTMPCTPTLTAADATVTITQPTPCNRVIKSNCCENNDKYVAVNAWCTPGYLIDQIVWIDPIKIDQVWCQLRVSFDGSSLPDLDRKVAVNAWCNPDYLDPLIVNTSSIRKNVAACKMWFDIDPGRVWFKRPWAKIGIGTRKDYTNLTLNQEQTLPTGPLAFTFPVTEAHPSFQSMITTEADHITIPLTGLYMVTMKGTAEVNDWVHAIRLYLQSSNDDADWGLDHKYGAAYSSWALTSVVSKGSLYGTSTTSTGNKIWWGWLMIVSFWQSEVFKFNQWDKIRLVLKYSTYVDDKHRKSTTGHICIPGTDGGYVTPAATTGRGKRAGMTLSAAYVGDVWVM